MPNYESVFIARQDMTPAQVEALTVSVSDILKNNGAKVTKTEQWGLKTLAYRINKNRKGHYVLINIEGPSACIQEMERTMRINEDVLRYLTVRMDTLEEGPSAMMRKSEYDDREGGDMGGFGGGHSGGHGATGVVNRTGRAPRRAPNEDDGDQ